MQDPRDHARRALRALAVYHARGEQALACLRAADHDGAEEWLARRAAAFHNFRTHDALALKAGFDLRDDAEAASLAARLRAQEPALAEAVGHAARVASAQANRIRAARRQLDGYRSGGVEDARFTNSV